MSAQLPRDAVRAAVAQRLGLHFPPERWAELARGFGAAARDIGCPTEDFMRAFVDGDVDRSAFDALAQRIRKPGADMKEVRRPMIGLGVLLVPQDVAAFGVEEDDAVGHRLNRFAQPRLGQIRSLFGAS